MTEFAWPTAWARLGAMDAAATDSIIRYAKDLLRFNRAQNLVSRRDPLKQITALIWESLCATQLVEPSSGPALDLGSGAGFPGLIFAMVDPDAEIDLLERRAGRCEFLRREVAALELGRVRVLERDAVEAADDVELAGRYGTVWLKAVAPPAQALALARPFVAPGGTAALLRQANWLPDKNLRDNWARVEMIDLPPEPCGTAERASAVHLFHI